MQAPRYSDLQEWIASCLSLLQGRTELVRIQFRLRGRSRTAGGDSQVRRDEGCGRRTRTVLGSEFVRGTSLVTTAARARERIVNGSTTFNPSVCTIIVGVVDFVLLLVLVFKQNQAEDFN
eukprot:scaffold41489_cov39-Prasinocladus_malaysianus.AAC.1